jgi:hypothetical protein
LRLFIRFQKAKILKKVPSNEAVNLLKKAAIATFFQAAWISGERAAGSQ